MLARTVARMIMEDSELTRTKDICIVVRRRGIFEAAHYQMTRESWCKFGHHLRGSAVSPADVSIVDTVGSVHLLRQIVESLLGFSNSPARPAPFIVLICNNVAERRAFRVCCDDGDAAVDSLSRERIVIRFCRRRRSLNFLIAHCLTPKPLAPLLLTVSNRRAIVYQRYCKRRRLR